MTTYRSTLGNEIVIPIAVTMVTTSAIFIVNEIWVGLAMNGAVMLFITHLFATTEYIISNGILRIRCGFIFHKTITIKTVKRISASSDMTSAPAFSLKRLEIQYAENNKVLISPKQREKFLGDLTAVNPKIEIVL